MTIAVIIAVLFGAYFLRHYFTPLAFAAIAAYLFSPVYNRLHRKIKSRSRAASLTLVLSFFVLLIPAALVLWLTVVQISHLTASLQNVNLDVGKLGQQVIDAINGVLEHIPGMEPVTAGQFAETIKNWLITFANGLVNFILSSIGGIGSLITSFFIYLYAFISLLVHKDYLLRVIKELNPLGTSLTETYLEKMGVMTTAMVKGQFVIALCQGFAEAGFFYIAGFHGIFFFLFILFSLLSIIPLGAGIITIPFSIGLILFGDIVPGLIILLGHLLVVTNIDNVLRPKLVPKAVKLDPALTLLAVFSGLAMFGFVGIVIGPVIMIIIKLTIEAYLEANKKRPVTEPTS